MNGLRQLLVENTWRRFVAVLLSSCLLVRALIPLGYMPGNLLAGEFMTLCSQTLPPPAAHARHHGHEDAAAPAIDIQGACPLGTALLAAAPPPAQPVTLSLSTGAALFLPPLSAVAKTSPILRFRSRAPPRPGQLINS